MTRIALASALLGAAIVHVTAHADGQAWQAPGDVSEMTTACQKHPTLQTFCRNGYLSIECGYQAVLLGNKLPIAPAPHVAWAKPYARGPLKVLVVSGFATAPIDFAQLAQVTRELDAEFRWVLVADAAVTNKDAADDLYRTRFLPEQARAALREDYDVILISFGTASPNHGNPRSHPYFPDDVYHEILRKVRRGTGLVLVGQNVDGYWAMTTPLAAALPATMTGRHWKLEGDACSFHAVGPTGAFAALNIDAASFTAADPLTLYEWQLRPDTQVLAEVSGHPAAMVRNHGKGRVLLLGWDGTLTPQLSRVGRTSQEHNLAIALRALVFAARKEPRLRVTIQDAMLPAGQAGGLLVNLNSAARLHYTLRDRDFRVIADAVVEGKPADNALALPPLAAGSYWLDLIAKDPRGRVLNWATQVVRVQSTSSLTVKTDREVYRIGDSVEITAIAGGDPAVANNPAQIEIRDAADRILVDATSTTRAGVLHFTYPLRDARVAPHLVTVRLLDATQGKPLLTASAQFFVPSSIWDDYENILWGNAPWASVPAQLRDEAGITAVLDGVGGDEVSLDAARLGLRVGRMNDATLDPGELQKDPSKGAAASDDMLKHAIAAAKRYGALAWSFQDERHQLADAGAPNADGVRRFRDYLKRQYANVAALNQSWGTRYARWDEIAPMLTASIANGVNNLAPWVDFRLYVADEAFRADARHASLVRAQLGAGTHIGIDGFTTTLHTVPFAGLDVGRLAASGVFDFFAPYDDDLLVTSLVHGPKAKYIGWGMPRQDYFSLPWRDVFRGHGGTLRFFQPTLYSEVSGMQPAGRWTAEGTEALRHGVGKLLMGAQRRLSPVVILYSYPSLITTAGLQYSRANQDGTPIWHAAKRSRDVIEQALLGSQVSVGYQTDAQVAAGGLEGKQLLILPALTSMALSDRTVKAIKTFVRGGGVVLADLAPGAYDEHGKLRASGGLNDLFGIERAERLDFVQQPSDYLANVTADDPLVPPKQAYVDDLFEKSLHITTARALGEHVADGTPAFIAKHTGRGRTLLLNLLLDSMLPSRPTPAENQYALLERVLHEAGIAPLVQLTAAVGEHQHGFEVNELDDRASSYFGFFAQPRAGAGLVTATAHFDAAKHTYEVRAGKYLGQVQDAPVSLRDGAALLARLDYRVVGIRLQATGHRRGEPIDVEVAVDTTGPADHQVVHIDVLTPNPERNHFYTRNLTLTAGVGRMQLFPALDDPAGEWRITAREVVSGESAQTGVRLE